jgi:hypothetical protein
MTGHAISRDVVRALRNTLAPAHILDRRSPGRTVVVVTGNDLEGLLTDNDGARATDHVRRITIPFADHMYGTEAKSKFGRTISKTYLVALSYVLRFVLEDLES